MTRPRLLAPPLIACLLAPAGGCLPRGPGQALGLMAATAVVTAAIVSAEPPPPPPVVYAPPPPMPGYVWQPGYWTRAGRSWYWVEGHWVSEVPAHQWVPTHWLRAPDGSWYLVRGHWRPVAGPLD